MAATNERLHDTVTAIVATTHRLHDRITVGRSAEERAEIAGLVESIASLERDFHRLTIERLSEVTYGAIGMFMAELESLKERMTVFMDEINNLRAAAEVRLFEIEQDLTRCIKLLESSESSDDQQR